MIAEHWGLVESTARRFAARGGHPQWSDDLCSAALVALWETASRWDPGCGVPFRVRLVRVIRLRLIDEWRRVETSQATVRRRTASLDELLMDGDGWWLADRAPGPEDVVVSAMSAAGLEAWVLSQGCRDGVIAARYWLGGEWLWEIAADVGVSECRVGQIVERQRWRLRSVVAAGAVRDVA